MKLNKPIIETKSLKSLDGEYIINKIVITYITKNKERSKNE